MPYHTLSAGSSSKSLKPVLKTTAAKKAFLMNRVGDVGLAIAIFLLWTNLGTLQYTEVFARVGELSPGALLAITVMLLLGACGKSGQFPLQAWLPDAMEGPTPVSALIHAATMVTAGVYLIARTHPIYDLPDTGRLVVAIIGTITLLIGAIIGCAYDDIKKVLAYSTVSQIGYMFLAVGLGPVGYALGIFHLLTHGFFKAGLFLGAGSVMHAMNDDVDMRRFGGLARFMPITFVTFGARLPRADRLPVPLRLLHQGRDHRGGVRAGGLAGLGVRRRATLAAGLTAFYMTRLVLMTFFGEKRWEKLSPPTARTSTRTSPRPSMTVPMIVLAIGSVGAGCVLARATGSPAGSRRRCGELQRARGPVIPHAVIPSLVLALSALGVLLAWLSVGRQPRPGGAPAHVSLPVRAARRDLYANAINEALIATPGTWLTRALVYFDNRGVDGLVNGIAALLGGSSGRLRRLQTGFVRSYALSMLGGAVLVVARSPRGEVRVNGGNLTPRPALVLCCRSSARS